MQIPPPSKESIQQRLSQIRKLKTNGEEKSNSPLIKPQISSTSSSPQNTSSSTVDLQSQFADAFTQGTVSKDKFGYFIQKANEQFQSYERELAVLKRRTTYFDPKELSISTSSESLSPSKKELFFHNMNKLINKDNVTLNEIQNEYNTKMVELFSENEHLNKMLDKMSFEVINKLNMRIQELDNKYKSSLKEKQEVLTKLNSMDSVFEQNSQMKEDIKEKEEELSELNSQQIKHINRIETLTLEIKKLNEEIRSLLDTISVKENTITSHLEEITFLKNTLEQRDKTITEKDKYIKEKEEEIKTLYTDNVQWEEKYSIQSKEIDNFKRWSLWDQNLIESFKKIEALEVDLLKANESVEKYQSENEQIKEKNAELSESLEKAVTSNKALVNENENLTIIKLKYEKEKSQFDDYIKVKAENANFKKELNNTVDKYESEIKTMKKNYEVQVNDQKNTYEHQINKITIEYENKLNDEKEDREREIKEKVNQIKEKEDQISTLQATNKELAIQYDNKSQMLTNLKDLYDKMLKKLENQSEPVPVAKEESIEETSPIVNENETQSNQSVPVSGQSKVYSTFDKFAFTKTLLIDYLFCLYLYENGIAFHAIIRDLLSSLAAYNSSVFQTPSSSLPCLQSEIIEDIYFTAFDLAITKKISSSSQSKKLFAINFEDFDRATINAVAATLISQNFISRIKAVKPLETLITLFTNKYDKSFDFDTNFGEYVKKEVVPTVTKRVNAQAKTLNEDLTTLIEMTLHNIKDGKVIINGREIYSFEKYYEAYFNMVNLSGRMVNLNISKKLSSIQSIDNAIHCIKFFMPSEVTFTKSFDIKDKEGKEMNTITPNNIGNIALVKITSSLSLYLPNRIGQLTISENSLSGFMFNNRILPLVRRLNALISLDLNSDDLNDDDIKNLCEFLKGNKTLKILKIGNNKITSTGGFFIADALTKNKSIEILDISHNKINESGISSLINVLSNNNKMITDLNIGYNDLKKEDYAALSEYFNQNPNLQIFDISGNMIDPLSANIIGISLKKAKNLKILKLNRTGLNEESCPQLLNYLNETNISDLELEGNSFGTMGPIIIIGKIKNSPNLKRVSLKQCDLSAMVLDFVAKNLKSCENLEIVNFEWNNFDDASFCKFCKDMEENTNILFKFSKSMISKKACEVIGELKNIILV